MDDRRLEKEVEAFDNFTSEVTPDMGNVHLVRPVNESLEEDLTLATKDLEHRAEISFPNVVTHEDFGVSQAGHMISRTEDDQPILAASKEIEIGRSSRQLRNKVVPLVATDGTAEDFTVNENDDNDESFNGKDTPNLKNTCQTSEKLTGSGRRKAAEGSETLNKEPPKKKFSHSTRRNKRRVDKVLLETPEDEINPRKLMLKDLILLAEAKERLLVADPNAANNSSPYQSTTFTQDTHFEEEVPFAYEEDQAERFVQPKLNYHTFMNKTSTERWSKQDTDLFYEGIQQFGTDFTLIQQLFPGRARAQVKSKYKKEEQQHPKRLFDALTNRSKNHSHFELVIERLQKSAADAEAEHDSDRDNESVGITGEEVEITPNTNEEVSKKPDENETNFEEEEVGEGMMEAEQVAIMNHQGHSPAKSHQESEGDVYDIWSEYKSDI
ncbi:transcription factor TFIIIB component B''-like [Papaver somniferum]|nr:transcription factor TFIIIB component B''-like [Papaver somniferum]